MIERVYYRVKLDANTFIYTPYLSNIPTSITDIPTNVTYDTTDGITLKTIGKWTYDNNKSSLVTTEREIPLKAGDGVTMDVSEDGKYVVIKVDPNKTNPHNVTPAQIGLGNVDNTSDANKPVSTAQQAALDKKIDKAGGTFSGNVAIQGNLTVSGTTTTESKKQLAVKENVIVTNADKVNLQTLLSGLAINKNSSATYGIMYDPADDTVKFGEGTLDANREFVFKAGEGSSVATRADSSQFTAGHLIKWDNTKKRFVDAGKSISEVVKTPMDLDLNTGIAAVTYDTTDGLSLTTQGTIKSNMGTDQVVVDYSIPMIGSNTISIDLDQANYKLVFKVNPNANLRGKSFTAKNVDSVTQSVNLNYDGYITITNPAGVTKIFIPWIYGDGSFLVDKGVKTLFGNESIVGTGNIDLYRHHILCSTPNEGIKVLITVISSKNLKVDSLTDLKTLLGNTFECPCTGYARSLNKSLAICNEKGFLPIDIWLYVIDPTPDIPWSNIESIVDTVTPI